MPQTYQTRKVGFATCARYRDLTADDRILAAALERYGIKVVPVVWTEARPESLQCDLLLVRSVWDYHLHPLDFMRWIDEVSKWMQVINAPTLIRWNMNKRYLREIEAKGFAVPKTVFLDQGTEVDLPDLLSLEGFREVVVKPVISASAFETRKIDEVASPDNPWLNNMLKSRPMMVQEFIPEIQTVGEWSLIFAGMEFTHAVLKAPRAGDFRVQEEHGGLHKRAVPPTEALLMAQKVLHQFGPEAAYCRVDLVMRQDRATLMELELIEPLLHFELAPEAAEAVAKHIISNEG